LLQVPLRTPRFNLRSSPQIRTAASMICTLSRGLFHQGPCLANTLHQSSQL
jgi:hypothetical protein